MDNCGQASCLQERLQLVQQLKQVKVIPKAALDLECSQTLVSMLQGVCDAVQNHTYQS